MGRYRKKPLVIEAWQFNGQRRNEWPDWLKNSGEITEMTSGDSTRPVSLIVKTREGSMRADLEDWVAKGVKDELYPIKPDIFVELYEPEEE